eukprot:gnl/Carplike_NY0171/2143_a2883_700.p1 GENE.gnl/Carplike_NY0171/2143_a2883_700~~gnl/Carplike_NY0171/2143_a2883_700.p1  ORF type:complete len:532 (+),score=169.85 gnl/Carplike_NY0171/2143_a2883_700:162-1598(+)
MSELEIKHPAAKMVVLAANSQALEIGDGTNFVVTLAGELLHQAAELITQGLVPKDIITGYEMGLRLCLEHLEKLVSHKLEGFDDHAELTKALRPIVMSKQYGFEDYLSPIIAQACSMVIPKKSHTFNTDNVRIVKIIGQSIEDSYVERGMILLRPVYGAVKHIKEGAKILVVRGALEPEMSETKGTIMFSSADEMLAFSKSEEDRIQKRVDQLVEAGVNVVVSGSSVNDLVKHYLDMANIMIIRIPSKWGLLRLGRSVGARPLVKFTDDFTGDMLGKADEVRSKEIGGAKCVVFSDDYSDEDISTGRKRGIATIVLRASTRNMLDDLEQCVQNAVSSVKAMTEDSRMVLGAGATELSLSAVLRHAADRTTGLEQYALRKFSEALRIIPRTLLQTCGLDTEKGLTMLSAAHEKGDTKMGVNIEAKRVQDCTMDAEKAGIFDLFCGKEWGLKCAVDAACTVLKVDLIIMTKEAGIKPKGK